MTLEGKNRWTASNATILAVATRNNGVFVGGGSGQLRLLNGIQTGIREIELDQIVTRIEVDSLGSHTYQNAVEKVYLGCGVEGVACISFGLPAEFERQPLEESSLFSESLLAGEYSDMHYFGSRFM
jgi:hypothetical protein